MFRPAGKYYADYMANKEELDRNNILEPALASINSAITPANHHDNTGTRSFLLGNEVTSVAGLATSKDAVDALQTALLGHKDHSPHKKNQITNERNDQ